MGDYWGNVNAYNVSGVDGVTVTSTASSLSFTIPNDSTGARAKQVRLISTGDVYVQFGHTQKGTTTATTNSIMVSSNLDMVVSCRQFDTIAYLQETPAAKLNVTPLEA